MGAVVLRQEPIRVTYRHPTECNAIYCDIPAAGWVVWLENNWTALRADRACTRHLIIAREHGGCLIFPLNYLPFDQVRAEVEKEIRRRRQPTMANSVFSNGFNITFTTTAGWPSG